MILCGTYEIEKIIVHPDDDPCESHYIDIVVDKDMPKFSVACCCDNEWSWDFWYSKTNYEVVKFLIMDCITDCRTIEELIDALDETFEESCVELLFNEAELQEDEFECDGDCENCVFNEDKYLH